MMYRAIGIVNKAPFDGVELVFVEFEVNGQKWNYEVKASAFYAYTNEWKISLEHASALTAFDYLQLHSNYGTLLGAFTNQFIADHQLDFQIQLIGSPGCNVFHEPDKKTVYALGDGAAVAAATGINTVSDYLPINAALGGSSLSISTYEKMIVLTDELYANAMAAAFFAVLRWREEKNLFAAETLATRDSIGGAVWIGQDW